MLADAIGDTDRSRSLPDLILTTDVNGVNAGTYLSPLIPFLSVDHSTVTLGRSSETMRFKWVQLCLCADKDKS